MFFPQAMSSITGPSLMSGHLVLDAENPPEIMDWGGIVFESICTVKFTANLILKYLLPEA